MIDYLLHSRLLWPLIVGLFLLSLITAADADYGPRPARWCGFFMRTRHGGGPEYNLAANWAHRGHADRPHVGAIVVWPHHVGEIVGRDGRSGLWIILSGNDGNAVRERPRSIDGAIAIRSGV